jgi:C4-dicarboxylate transporter
MIKTKNKSKIGLIIGAVLLMISLLFGIKLVQQNQENRSTHIWCYYAW